jgi:small subunit ribosomal protein S6
LIITFASSNIRSVNFSLTNFPLHTALPRKGGANPGKGELNTPMKRAYEVIVVVRLDIEEGAVNNTIDQVKNWIETDEGKVQKVDRWGRRKLAYEIEKQREGYYVLMDAEMESRGLDELERNMNLSQNLLRYLIVRKGE